MKANEIKVGGVYIAKVSGKLTKVRVDLIRSSAWGRGKKNNVFDVTNLSTKRTTTFRSAAKFRKVAGETEMPVPKKKVESEKVEQSPATGLAALKTGKPTAIVKATQQVVMTGIADILNGKDDAKGVLAKVDRSLGKPVPTSEVFALDDEDKKVVEERKAKKPSDPPVNPYGIDHAMYAEIVVFEKKVGHPWWKYAHKNETWASYKARGCPLTLPMAPIVAKGPPEPQASPAPSVRPATPASSQPKKVQPAPAKPATADPAPATQSPKPKPATGERTEHKNSLGILCETSAEGTKFALWGVGHCAIFRYIGSRGWGRDEVKALWSALGLKEAGAGSVNIELNAGRKNVKLPPLTPSQVELLESACGKRTATQPPAASKPKPTPKKTK